MHHSFGMYTILPNFFRGKHLVWAEKYKSSVKGATENPVNDMIFHGGNYMNLWMLTNVRV